MAEQPKWYEKMKWQPPGKEKDGWHCPTCGAVLSLRTNRRDMTSFLGCTRHMWTGCDYTSPATEQEMTAKLRKEQAQSEAFISAIGRS